MAVNKPIGATAYINVESFQYKGPEDTLYLYGVILQGGALVYVATSSKSVPVMAAGDWYTVYPGKQLTLTPTGAVINRGLADVRVIIMDGPNAGTAKTLKYLQWPGGCNFT